MAGVNSWAHSHFISPSLHHLRCPFLCELKWSVWKDNPLWVLLCLLLVSVQPTLIHVGRRQLWIHFCSWGRISWRLFLKSMKLKCAWKIQAHRKCVACSEDAPLFTPITVPTLEIWGFYFCIFGDKEAWGCMYLSFNLCFLYRYMTTPTSILNF